ncbi:MAG: hypothetical protein ACI9XO_000262 [Paraglaciecola sp.]|jgi:hypothetical protein
MFLQIDDKVTSNISVVFRHSKKVVDCEQNGNLFTIDVPRMRGGFSQLFGQRFMEYNPLEYKNILVFKDGIEIEQLSVNDIYKLDKIELGSIEAYRLMLH